MSNTSSPPPPLTLEDLLRCGADEILNLPEPTTAYHEIWSRLFSGAKASIEDNTKTVALDFLAKICSMMLEPDDKAAPFKAMLITLKGRSMLPEDLSPEDIEIMGAFAPTVEHPLLRARLADLVWFKDRRKGIAFAHMAIKAYRQPSITAEGPDREVLMCRQRAIQLALSIGKGGGNLMAEIAGELLEAFWRAVECDDQAAALRYLRPLQTERLAGVEAGKIAETLESIARRQLHGDDPFSSLKFAECAVIWFGRAREDEHRARAQILVAESWGAQGEQDGSGITLHHCYAKAIDAYRLVSARYRTQFGVSDAIALLRSKLPAAGLDMLGRMKTVSHSFDISDLVAEAVGSVQGLPPVEAFFAFCRVAPWPSVETLRSEAAIPLDGLGALFATTSVDDDGRVIAHEEGVSDMASRERRLDAEMIKACARRADIAAQALISPALDIIRQQFHLSLHEFSEIAGMSALVTSDRADIVGKGLYAGYCRDFVQAIHILIPQFEHMVRMVLKAAGAQTTSRQDGIEMELGLSALVDLPEMQERFGEHLAFNIRALMCNPLGPNLRNQVAHGLAGSRLCLSGYGVYAWWLILALVVEGFHMMQKADEANSPDGADAN